VLESLKIALGGYKLRDLTRSALIEYGKTRAKAGPAIFSIDFSFIGTVLRQVSAKSVYKVIWDFVPVTFALD
jgi:hypothetical protein